VTQLAASSFLTAPHLFTAVKTDWTEADLTDLPQDGHRYEIISGRLYVSPPAGENHQSASAEIFLALRHAAPAGWRVLFEIGLTIGEDRFIPDLVVLPPDTPAANADYNDCRLIRPALVVEIASRSTETTDQGDKMVAYARGGIPAYWRVEMDGTLVLHELGPDGTYVTAATLGPDEQRDLDLPFPVTVTAHGR
jgi:Uma2 family endonuclease